MTGGMEKQSYELITGMRELAKVHQLCYTGSESKLMFFIKLKYRVKKILKAHPGISVVHMNDGVMALFCLWIKRHTDAKIVATVHGLDVVFPNKIFQKRLLPRFNMLDQIICVSRFTAQACIDRGIRSEILSVVNNGVDHNLDNSKSTEEEIIRALAVIGYEGSDKKIMLSIGRAVQRKGMSWYISQVIPLLPDDYLYVMVGPKGTRQGITGWLYRVLPRKWKEEVDLFWGWPNDSERIDELLEDESVARRAVHLGKVDWDLLQTLIEISDVFVMPNISVEGDAEGFGLVALEAALKSKSVLAADIEGITDAIMDRENGILIRSGDAVAWAETVVQLLSDPVSAEALGRHGCAYTKANYSWAKMVRGYYDLFVDLTSHNSDLSKKKRPQLSDVQI